jgi:hypothetical protein
VAAQAIEMRTKQHNAMMIVKPIGFLLSISKLFLSQNQQANRAISGIAGRH